MAGPMPSAVRAPPTLPPNEIILVLYLSSAHY